MDLDLLERQVQRHRRVAFVLFSIVLLAFASRHLFDDTSCRSGSTEAWGQFGDFVGGILNPMIAFLAFFWLTQSVLIQRSELKETKQALTDSARSQAMQAKYAERTVVVGALGSVLDYHNNEVEALRHIIESVSEQARNQGWAISPDGRVFNEPEVGTYLQEVRKKLSVADEARAEVLREIRGAIRIEA